MSFGGSGGLNQSSHSRTSLGYPSISLLPRRTIDKGHCQRGLTLAFTTCTRLASWIRSARPSAPGRLHENNSNSVTNNSPSPALSGAMRPSLAAISSFALSYLTLTSALPSITRTGKYLYDPSGNRFSIKVSHRVLGITIKVLRHGRRELHISQRECWRRTRNRTRSSESISASGLQYGMSMRLLFRPSQRRLP